MTRFAVDLRPMLKVLVGEQRLELPERPLNFSTLNVYYMLKIDDPFVTPVDVEIEQGLDTVIRFFIEHGSRTIPLDTAHKFHDLRYALFLWCTAMNDPNNPSYLNLLTEGRRAAINPYWELLKCMVGRNKEYTAAILTLGISEELGFTSGEVKKDVYEAMLERLKKDLHELLSTDGVLICPTFPEIGKLAILDLKAQLSLCLHFVSPLSPHSLQAQPVDAQVLRLHLHLPVECNERGDHDGAPGPAGPPRHAPQRAGHRLAEQ